jgi:hypothetical protein
MPDCRKNNYFRLKQLRISRASANDLRGTSALSSDRLLFEYDRRRAGVQASASERDPRVQTQH